MIPSPIEWLWHFVRGWLVPGYTFNPWIGCEKVSAGCKNCYASVDTYARVSKSRGLPLWGPGSSRHKTSEDYWKGPLRLAKRARVLSCIMGFEVRPRVFLSLCDPFEDRIDLLEWRAELFRLIEATPELDWLLLTKRPENVRRAAPNKWFGRVGAAASGLPTFLEESGHWPSNVWLGTSVEDAAHKTRIDELRKIAAHRLFLSIEPLLEDLGALNLANIHWVIVGGESGSSARPMHPDWVRGIREQCIAAGVPFFFKQWGEWSPSAAPHGTPFHYADGSHGHKVGKKNAGRILDGRTWEEQPK